MSARVRPDDIPREVHELCRALESHGYRAWVVGGCLRDLLRARKAADWDLATTALPEQVQRVFPRVIPTGIQHGTVTVHHRGHSYELTTLRGEGAYSDGRRPDTVEFVSDIVADLARRDFTVNAMAYDPILGELLDPFGGLDDLDRHVIRAVGKAEERFSEDGLRVLRAARFAATLGFNLDPATEAAIAPTLDTFRKVSAERVREEWVKALRAERPSRAFMIMARTGILAATYPELAALSDDERARAFAALDAAPHELVMRMAALLSPLATDLPGVADWLTRYRFSNQERDRIVRILGNCLPADADQYTDADVRRYARRVGREWLDEVTLVGTVVARCVYGVESSEQARAERLRARVCALVKPDTPLVSKELAIGGRDLIKELGIKPGPQLGDLIDALLESVLDHPALNTRESLLALAKERVGGGG